MPQLNFPAPGSLSAVQHLEDFGGFDLTPSTSYRYTNLLTWSEDLTNTSWLRQEGIKNYTSDYDVIDNFQFDTDVVKSSPVRVFRNSTPANIADSFTITITSNIATFGQQLNVEPNKTYSFSFYARQGTAANVAYRIYDNTNYSNIVPTTFYASSITANSWTRITNSFTTSITTTSITAYFIDSIGNNGLGSTTLYWPQIEQGSLTDYNSTQSISLASLGFTSNSGSQVSTFGNLTNYIDTTYDFAPVLYITGISTIKYNTATNYLFDEDLITKTTTVASSKIFYFTEQPTLPYALGETVRITDLISGTTKLYTVENPTVRSITITTDDVFPDAFVVIARITSTIYDINKLISDYSRNSFTVENSNPRSRYYLTDFFRVPYAARRFFSTDELGLRSFSNTDNTFIRSQFVQPGSIRLVRPVRDNLLTTDKVNIQYRFVDIKHEETKLKATNLAKQLERLREVKDNFTKIDNLPPVRFRNEFVLDDIKFRQLNFVKQIDRLYELAPETYIRTLTYMKAVAVLRPGLDIYQKTDIPDFKIPKFNQWVTRELTTQLLDFKYPLPSPIELTSIEVNRREQRFLEKDRGPKLKGLEPYATYNQSLAKIERQDFLRAGIFNVIDDLRQRPGVIERRLFLNAEVLGLESTRRIVANITANSQTISQARVSSVMASFPKTSYTPQERYILDLARFLYKFPATNDNDPFTFDPPVFDVDTQILNLRQVPAIRRLAIANVAGIFSSSIYDKDLLKNIPVKFPNVLIASASDAFIRKIDRLQLKLNIRATPDDGNRLKPALFKLQNKVAVVDNPGIYQPQVFSKWNTFLGATSETNLAQSLANLNKFYNKGAAAPEFVVIGQSNVSTNILDEYIFDLDIVSSSTTGNANPTQTITILPEVKIDSPAAYFDGFRAFIETSASGMFSLGPNATIEMHIRPMSLSPIQVITSFWSNDINLFTNKLDVYLNSSLQVCVGLIYPLGVNTAYEHTLYFRTEQGLSTSVLNHLALVITNNIVNIYINGQQQRLVGNNSIAAIGGNNTQLRIGFAGDTVPIWR